MDFPTIVVILVGVFILLIISYFVYSQINSQQNKIKNAISSFKNDTYKTMHSVTSKLQPSQSDSVQLTKTSMNTSEIQKAQLQAAERLALERQAIERQQAEMRSAERQNPKTPERKPPQQQGLASFSNQESPSAIRKSSLKTGNQKNVSFSDTVTDNVQIPAYQNSENYQGIGVKTASGLSEINNSIAISDDMLEEIERVRSGMRPSYLGNEVLGTELSDNIRPPTAQGMRASETLARSGFGMQDSGLGKKISRTIGAWGGQFPSPARPSQNPNNGLLLFNRSELFADPDAVFPSFANGEQQGIIPNAANVVMSSNF